MMIDTLTEFCDDVALVLTADTSTHIGVAINTVTVQNQAGGQPLYLMIIVADTITGDGANVTFRLMSDGTATVSPTTGTEHIETAQWEVGPAGIAAGTILAKMPIPGEGTNYEQFLGIVQDTAGGTALTAGNVDAFLTPHLSQYTRYAAATN